jgi:glucosamine--fructose-6-phosphate aminotransferase (isomerizing)
VCGIVGYVGFREAKKVVLDCLKRLDYRGYDSAGIGILDKKLQLFKEIGEIAELEKTIPMVKGDIAVGHTRWATHGGVTKTNAHPHVSCDKKIAVVHNGIIENFKPLRESLEERGHKFTSQTDTEVVAHLIEEEYQGDLQEAVFSALQKIKGSYALLVMCEDDPRRLIGARKESPLIVGVGDNENFFASDAPALLRYTNRVIYLDDGEVCVLGKNTIHVFDENKQGIRKEEKIIHWDMKDAEKSGFPHFMLKEIYDQPDALRQALRGRVSEVDRSIIFPSRVEALLNNRFDSVHIVACGTSYYAGLVGKYLLEEIAGVSVSLELASEYRYFGIRDASSLVVAITQSGETADTLAALKEAKNAGSRTLVVTNVIGSTATRIADGFVLTQSGPEIGVAATKTFTAQIMVLMLIALKIALVNDKISADEVHHYMVGMKDVTRHVREVLNRSDSILEIARVIKDAQSVFYIGRGINYPLSLEGALKLKEISYVHAEGFAAGELKHGPFALLTKDSPVVAIVTRDATYDKMIANIGEVKARGSPVIAVADDNDTEIEKYADFVLRFPHHSGMLSCVSIAVVLQLLAYHVADLRGCRIDKPRNLAKSVTVE